MIGIIINVAIITLIAEGLRYLLWKDEVPEPIFKFRWGIGIFIALMTLIISTALRESEEGVNTANNYIYILLAWSIANALDKRQKKDDRKK